jgi:hypothetical protein
MNDLIVIRNAKVSVKLSHSNMEPTLALVIDGGSQGLFEHTFPIDSAESKGVFDADLATLTRHYDGGTYAFKQGTLVQYKPSSYRGFIQSNDAISHLADSIGMRMTTNGGKYRNGVAGLYDSVRTRNTNGAMFGGEGDPFGFDVKELGLGGEFDASLVAKWSVFSPNIEITMNVKRLVCANGMVADSPFVTRSVPVISNWEENMGVVRAQLEPHMSGIMQQRFREMANTRASVASLARATGILNKRSSSKNLDDADRQRLLGMAGLVDVKKNLGHYYAGRALSDQKVAAALAGHLTAFDLYNVMTEASSHYGRDGETDKEATMLANRIMFDELSTRPTDTGTLKPSSDSDHRRAFFGK